MGSIREICFVFENAKNWAIFENMLFDNQSTNSMSDLCQKDHFSSVEEKTYVKSQVPTLF